jgi:hemolysin activation/secretion protein
MRYAAATILAASVGAAWAQEPDSGVIRFEIARFAVSGNTLLPQARVDAIVLPFAGPSRDFGDVQRALEALEQAYHELGYNLVQVELPEQELNKGVVRLKVVITTGALNLAVSGKGSVVGARYSQVLARGAAADRRLVYGVESKAFKNVVLFAGQNFGYDVTVHPVSVDYQANHTMGTASAAYSVGLVRNIPGGSNGDEAALRLVRTNAKASYTVMRLSASYTQTLASQWLWRVLANGQLSADALVPGEQFGAGGNSSVRGFDERVLAADSGMTVNAELYTPPLGQGPWVTRVLGFVDLAHGKRNKTIVGELGSASISSAGLGLRVARGDSVNLQLDWGRVITDDGFAPSGKNKVHVRLGLAY